MIDLYLEKVDNTKIKISGNDGVIKELSDHLTFDAPNAKFDPRVKKRIWDGKIRMIDMRSKTCQAGLAFIIHDWAKEKGYKIKDKTNILLENNFTTKEAIEFCDTLNLPFKPNDHQIQAFVEAVRKKRSLLVSPTASGKSLIAYLITRYFHKQTLIIVPTINLVEQMAKDFEDYGDRGMAIFRHHSGLIKTTTVTHKIHPVNSVHISTWQTLMTMPPAWFNKMGFELVIGDEAHGFKAKSLLNLMNCMPNIENRIGMTGTLDNKEVHDLLLQGVFGKIYKVTTTEQLIEDKKISDLKIDILVLKHSKKRPMDYHSEKEYIINHERRNKFIINLAASLKGNTLVLFQNIQHGSYLYTRAATKNLKSVLIYGKTEAEEREEIRAIAEQTKDMIIIASYGVFSTGANIKNIHNIIFASPTKSRIRVLQSIGRGLRLHNEKEYCTVYDIADDLQQKPMNFSLKHMIERVKIYNSENFKYKFHMIELKDDESTIY